MGLGFHFYIEEILDTEICISFNFFFESITTIKSISIFERYGVFLIHFRINMGNVFSIEKVVVYDF